MAKENNRPQRKQDRDDGLCKKLIAVNRITKVVKGGRKMRFAALVVVGDENGKVGCGSGKANEVPEAIDKATAQAKKAMRKVSTVGTTIPHTVIGKFGRGTVLMMPAEEGTGVIAGGPVRAVLEMVGIKDSPTTISAVKRKLRPPLTTLATRLMYTSLSLSSTSGVSIRFCI